MRFKWVWAVVCARQLCLLSLSLTAGLTQLARFKRRCWTIALVVLSVAAVSDTSTCGRVDTGHAKDALSFETNGQVARSDSTACGVVIGGVIMPSSHEVRLSMMKRLNGFTRDTSGAELRSWVFRASRAVTLILLSRVAPRTQQKNQRTH